MNAEKLVNSFSETELMAIAEALPERIVYREALLSSSQFHWDRSHELLDDSSVDRPQWPEFEQGVLAGQDLVALLSRHERGSLDPETLEALGRIGVILDTER